MWRLDNSPIQFLVFIAFLFGAILLNSALANDVTNSNQMAPATTAPAPASNSMPTSNPTPAANPAPAAAPTPAPATSAPTAAVTSNQAASTTSVISYTVQNVDPAQIADTLQRLYGNQINIAAQQQQLLIRVNSSQAGEVQNLLPQLDKAPRQLLITVRQNIPANELQSYFNAANGDVSSQPTQSSVTTQDRGAQGDLAEIQATEGQPARVALNSTIPLISGVGNYPTWGPGPGGPGGPGGGKGGFANSGGYVGYSYASMMTGFDVIARVVNKDALLDISAFNGAPVANAYNTTESSNQHTTLRVPLGQWALIGGTGVLDTQGSTSFQTGRSTNQGNSATIIRVNLIGSP